MTHLVASATQNLNSINQPHVLITFIDCIADDVRAFVGHMEYMRYRGSRYKAFCLCIFKDDRNACWTRLLGQIQLFKEDINRRQQMQTSDTSAADPLYRQRPND